MPHIWKVEHESLTKPLHCYASGPKRYALFRPDECGRIEEVDWSEHGLGVLLDPSAPEDGTPRRDQQGRRIWTREAWRWLLGREFGQDESAPRWLDRFALTPFSLSHPTQLAWFAGRDATLRRADRMRPASFGLLAHSHAFLSGLSAARPAAPHERNPARWRGLPWYDRLTGKAITLSITNPATAPDRFVAEHERGGVRVKTIADVLAAYFRRPDYKSLTLDGEVAHGQARGLLVRRPIESAPSLTKLTSKEGTKLLERAGGELAGDDPGAYRIDLGGRVDIWTELLQPAARALGAASVAASIRLHRRTVERAVSGRTRPQGIQLARWAAGLAHLARRTLEERGAPVPDSELACLQAFLDELPSDPRLCACGCGVPLTGQQMLWASEACRKRADRRVRCSYA